jgi:hypothetical protein
MQRPPANKAAFETFVEQRGSKGPRSKAQREQLFREFESWRAKQGGAQ